MEFLIECPKTIAETVARNLKLAMETAAQYHCTIIPLKATPVITEHWTH